MRFNFRSVSRINTMLTTALLSRQNVSIYSINKKTQSVLIITVNKITSKEMYIMHLFPSLTTRCIVPLISSYAP